jgi:urease accessory protein
MFFSEEKNQKTFMSFAGTKTNLERANGAVQVGVRLSDRGTVLNTLRQQGCLKARFPRVQNRAMEAVLINTSGGVTNGDQLDISLHAAEGSELTLSTPSAEKIYRALPNTQAARITTRATLEAGARLDYLPQETLLFDGSALDRTLTVDLHPTAHFLSVDALLFGRTLSGETLTTLHLRDTLSIRRGSRLILRDGVRLQGDVTAKLRASAAAGEARAIATIVFVAPEAETLIDAVRDALTGAEAGASAWDGMLLARLVAVDGQELRRLVVAVLARLRENPLPRLWAS